MTDLLWGLGAAIVAFLIFIAGFWRLWVALAALKFLLS